MKQDFKANLGMKALDLVRSGLILWGLFELGEWLSSLTNIGIPGSIYGLLILFIGLTSGTIKVKWIYAGASLLIRYMAILFVPVSVGIVQYGDLLKTQGIVLTVPNIVSTCVTMVIMAFFADYIFSLKSFSRLRKKVAQKRASSL